MAVIAVKGLIDSDFLLSFFFFFFFFLSNGSQSEDLSWPENIENVQMFLSAGFISWLFYLWNCYCCSGLKNHLKTIQKKYFSASYLSYSGCGHGGSLFTNKEQRKFGLGCV